MDSFDDRLRILTQSHSALLMRRNRPRDSGNGVYQRWRYPIVTPDHVPLSWRYDLRQTSNPYLMERQGVNATFNAGALLFEGKHTLVVRVEGVDRKSFFAVAQSSSGVDGFEFHDFPIDLPQTEDPDINVYDMRLTQHEDGYIYGLFCTERKDRSKPHDTSAAVAGCGIARTTDLVKWERLPDLISETGQQRNVVLHPEFVDGHYGLYTRPQDGFISVGSGGGIGWTTVPDIAAATVRSETTVDARQYHTIKEVKNGLGPPPIRTDHGWLQLAHGVRNTAAGLRYVLYLFMTALDEPWRIIHQPAGHLIAPAGNERVGDVSNVVFSNGWTVSDDDSIHIYYASSDTRMHVATTSVDQLVDYVRHTPEDGLCSAASVQSRTALIRQNLQD